METCHKACISNIEEAKKSVPLPEQGYQSVFECESIFSYLCSAASNIGLPGPGYAMTGSTFDEETEDRD
ncbi:hypothetical protein PISMIDRAFT_687769 [Pisolithus microcarpus 441]|uniref:Uncharacterized protein n=1 Tax=Pisolithus microcarpus 441 TaxID=765257 RepID=A0A0C9YLE7_9AGAM|nr:hypothetical protein PISMIDRAFT_687769 [Pisolithus microcarpus 441]